MQRLEDCTSLAIKILRSPIVRKLSEAQGVNVRFEDNRSAHPSRRYDEADTSFDAAQSDDLSSNSSSSSRSISSDERMTPEYEDAPTGQKWGRWGVDVDGQI